MVNTENPPKNKSVVSFHMGEALIRVASEYPSLLDVILEQVQNALDANAKHIFIRLDCKTSRIVISDDGDGVSRESFENALNRICQSQKEIDKLGRFGIGLISPLDKCHSFTFTSCRRGSEEKGYSEWTFTTKDIRKQHKGVTVPHRLCPELAFILREGARVPDGKEGVQWRTKVVIERYSSDKYISRVSSSIDGLIDAILDRFSAAMRRNNTILDVSFKHEDGTKTHKDNIGPKLFSGRPLGDETIIGPEVGKVLFRLYESPKTTSGQNGKVVVGEMGNDFRFGFKLFARSARNQLSEEIINMFNSGMFEGEILGENVSLHSERKSFNEDDAFIGFCKALVTWFEKYGEKHLDRVKENRRELRYQKLGLRSLDKIKEILSNPAFKDISEVIDFFDRGSVGAGHSPVPKKLILGTQTESSVSTQGGFLSKKGDGKSQPPDLAKKEQANHKPFTVAGPHGKQRTLVKHSSVGLQFSYDQMEGDDRLWVLDAREGILHFNVYHPIWSDCEKSDTKLMQLQETVALFALVIEGEGKARQEALQNAFDKVLPAMVYLFHHSASFNFLRNPKKSEGK